MWWRLAELSSQPSWGWVSPTQGGLEDAQGAGSLPAQTAAHSAFFGHFHQVGPPGCSVNPSVCASKGEGCGHPGPLGNVPE